MRFAHNNIIAKDRVYITWNCSFFPELGPDAANVSIPLKIVVKNAVRIQEICKLLLSKWLRIAKQA